MDGRIRSGGGQEQGRMLACVLVIMWLAEWIGFGEGGAARVQNGRSRKLLEARKETWWCCEPEAYARLHRLPPIDGERPEILTAANDNKNELR